MYESTTVPIPVVLVYLLWSLAVAAFGTSCVLMSLDDLDIAMMFGFVALIFTALGAVAIVRCYVMRVCSLIRAVHGLDSPETASLHPIG